MVFFNNAISRPHTSLVSLSEENTSLSKLLLRFRVLLLLLLLWPLEKAKVEGNYTPL